jgi:transketolase
MNRKDRRVIDTIRFLSADAVEKANSGHPGLPLGSASMAYTLWSRHLKGSATDPKWLDRDRFILSAGHGSMLLYSLLHLFGYGLTITDLQQFRQWHSKTPGHPEHDVTPGVETSTGPLGQGFANGVGMAMAERRLGAEFNTEDYKIVDHYTYVLAGDGDLMEGISSEASSLAGHLKLGKLIVLYDDNKITIDGSTDLTFTENVEKRYEAYGWQVIKVTDGNDIELISDAIQLARIDVTKPTLIMVRNIIGYGAPSKAGLSDAHGAPLGSDEISRMKRNFGWDDGDSFVVPDDVDAYLSDLIDRREIERFIWEERFDDYAKKYPQKAMQWTKWHEFEIDDKDFDLKQMMIDLDQGDATRNSGGKVLNALQNKIGNLFGGSADLNGSTKTYLKGAGDFSYDEQSGSNIFFGIREFAMAAICNGIALHGGLRSFGSTFLVFSDYLKPALRLSALMKLPVLYIFTHDSIGVGEDGPTHQPVEHLWMLRSIPNVKVFRPADPIETAVCFVEAFKNAEGPSVIILSRQKLPLLPENQQQARRGGYVVVYEEKSDPDVVLIGTGSELQWLIEAREELLKEDIDARVVSMPCLEIFDHQSETYKNDVLPDTCTLRLVIEAGISGGWYKYVGSRGALITMDRFGESAPGDVLMKQFGFSKDAVVDKVRALFSY